MVLNIYKPLGITSYDVIRQLKKVFPKEKIGHAGTLDPLAEGVLICLTGKDTRRQAEFMTGDKTYEFEVLFGFETDTFDILGKVQSVFPYSAKDIESKIPNVINNFVGEIEQTVPLFSAIKVQGTPLYRATLSGNAPQHIEKRKVTVNSLKIQSSEIITKQQAHEKIINLIDKVKKGFRQHEIKEIWNETFLNINQNSQENYLTVKFLADVSKGTYVRSLAYDMGKLLGTGACTTVIIRTRVADQQIADSVTIENVLGDLV